MAQYSIQSESKCIFETLLQDETLSLPSSFVEAARRITFVRDDPKPFIPTPCKITESSSSLTALVAAAASAVATDRYGIDYQEIEVNTDLATLFLESVLLPTVNGKSFLQNPTLQAEFKKGDLYEIDKPIHMEATNVYKTSDGCYYHLHGSLNAAATMKMIGVEEQDVARDEAIQIYTNEVAQFNSEYLEQTANEVYKEAGVTRLTPEEFLASEQGKIMGAEPLWTTRAISAPKTSWPDVPDKDVDRKFKPLAGIRVIDFHALWLLPSSPSSWLYLGLT